MPPSRNPFKRRGCRVEPFPRGREDAQWLPANFDVRRFRNGVNKNRKIGLGDLGTESEIERKGTTLWTKSST